MFRLATLGLVGVTAVGANAVAPHVIISKRENGRSGFIELPDVIMRHSNRMTNGDYHPFNRATRDAVTSHARETFFEQFGSAFGIARDQLRSLRVNHAESSGISNYFYDQYIKGYKVFGGDVVVVVGSDNEVMRLHGIPLDQSVIPADATTGLVYTTLDSVRDVLSAHVAEQGNALSDNLTSELVWFRSELLTQGEAGHVSLVLQVHGNTVDAKGFSNKFDAFIDAKSGSMVDFIQRSDNFFNSEVIQQKKKSRKLRLQQKRGLTQDVPTPEIGSLLVVETNNPDGSTLYHYPSTSYPSDPEGASAIANTYYVTYMMRSISNQRYETWHEDNVQLNIEVNIPEYFNAYFDGKNAIHIGDGLAVDDVMAHEWGHGYTDTINGLIYKGQSGALNEGYSDVWGESMDILQIQTSSQTLRSQTQTCTNGNWDYEVLSGTDAGTRWLMGEDIDGSATDSCAHCALRDMYYPECFGDPSTTKSDNYYCGRQDNQGVHTNSGVLNRLYSVLVDGGKQGTTTINAIGQAKSMALFLATAEGLSSSSQFSDFASIALSTCNAMIGTDIYIPDIVTGASVATSGLTKTDCSYVDTALNALYFAAPVCK